MNNTEPPKTVLRATHDAILKGIILQHELLLNDIKEGYSIAFRALKDSSNATTERNEELAKQLAKTLVLNMKLKKKLREIRRKK